MAGVDYRSRTTNLQQIRQAPNIPVLIIGSDRLAIGLFRELALQGIPAYLVTPQDYFVGTAVPTAHLIHNDVSYRENGGFRAVKTAVAARERLENNAPHAIIPISTTVPIFRWVTGRFHVPIKLPQEVDKTGRRGMLFTRLGLIMQDTVTKAKGTMFSHSFAFRDSSLTKYPALNPDILGTATYYNGIIPFPEQLCLEMIQDGCLASPQSVALNHMPLQKISKNTAFFTDSISGETVQIQPQIIFQSTSNAATQKRVNLVVEHPKLRQIVGDHAFFFEHENGRFVRIYPYSNQHLMLSTTFPQKSAEITSHLTKQEITDTLNLVQQLFPQINLAQKQIRFQLGTQLSHQAILPSVTQHKENKEIAVPIYQLPASNWGNYRLLVKNAAEHLFQHLHKSSRQHTNQLAIGGGKGYPHNRDERWRWFHKISRDYNLAFEHVKLLFSRYGTRTRMVAAFLADDADTHLKHNTDYTQREILYLIRSSQVNHLDDLILRRTQLAQRGKITADLIAELGQITCKALQWSQKRLQSEIERTFTLLATSHGVSLYEL
ncbi:MAG: hypothetical protein GY943_08270 [Chloroflexi bacterium]|nr:hypothetical protein [Chloroflexota bacterium]